MKRPDHNASINIRHLSKQTFLHLFSRLISKCDRQNFLVRLKLWDQTKNTLGERMRFSGAWPGDNQKMSAAMHDRPLLGVIKIILGYS